MLHKAWHNKEEMPYCFPRSSIKFQGHTGQNITDFDPNWAFPDYRPVAAFRSLRFDLFYIILKMYLHNTKYSQILNVHIINSISYLHNGACHPGGHWWYFILVPYPQFTATNLKIGTNRFHLQPAGALMNRIDGLAEDCSNSSALAMELLQSCA